MDNSDSSSHPVGSKAPNTLGLYDMSGNVAELFWSGFSGDCRGRGGYYTAKACDCVVASGTFSSSKTSHFQEWGFRLAQSIVE